MVGGNLIVSFKASPFPYAAVAIASYTNKAQVNYDESASGLNFTFEGTQITAEEGVVRALAKAGGLAEDSVKVCTLSIIIRPIWLLSLSPQRTSLWPIPLLQLQRFLRS
jgi:glutamyl-tRNA synthetase